MQKQKDIGLRTTACVNRRQFHPATLCANSRVAFIRLARYKLVYQKTEKSITKIALLYYL